MIPKNPSILQNIWGASPIFSQAVTFFFENVAMFFFELEAISGDLGRIHGHLLGGSSHLVSG